MNDHVIEIVSFKLNADTSVEEFLATIPAVNEFVQTQKGFVSRRLSINESGEWLEHIEWECITDAMAASTALMGERSCQPMMAALDMQSVKMGHNQLMISLG